jgi:amino acid transporter
MNDPKLKWLYYAGPIIMLIGMLGLRVNSLTQKSFYAGTIVQPMSEEGFFPESFGTLSKKDNMSVKASFLNIIITLIVAMIWLIVPDIISGVRGATSQKDDIFRINDFQSMATIICIFVYIMAMISIVKLGLEGKMKIVIFEWIMYFVAGAFLIFFFAMYYEELVRVNIINGDSTQKVRAFISIGFTLLCVAFFFVWYAIYYRPKQKLRSVKYQTQLDNNFKLDDD